MRIGLISDTHNLVDPSVLEHFSGVEHILHAGDIGSPGVVTELERIAPVTAVLGNTDDPGLWFRQTEIVELCGRKFLVHHIVNPHQPADPIRALLERERPAVVVFGHSHKPFCQTIGGTLFLNPGYASKPKLGMDRSVAVLHCDKKSLRAEFRPLR